jgi:hypothetical protein
MAEALKIPETDVDLLLSSKSVQYKLKSDDLYQKMNDIMSDETNPYKIKLEQYFGKLSTVSMREILGNTLNLSTIKGSSKLFKR